MRKFLMIGAAAAALFATQAAFAETPVGADKQSAIAVTIYNNDLALVRDSRTVTLTQGDNELAFIEVSAGIRPETALLTGRGTPLDIVEQNFDFDLLTPQKLLEKSVGQTIRVVRTNPETGADTTEDATVLSVAEGQVVLKIGDRIEVTPPGRLVYSAVPANLRDRPTLVVKLASQQAGDVPVDLSYLTRGLSWAADYVAELSPDEKTLNLNGWVTLTNMSGIAYNNAKLQLVAGEVNQYQPQPPMPMAEMMAAAGMAVRRQKMSSEAAFEYHLYSLDRPTTLKENQTKQVALLAAESGAGREEIRAGQCRAARRQLRRQGRRDRARQRRSPHEDQERRGLAPRPAAADGRGPGLQGRQRRRCHLRRRGPHQAHAEERGARPDAGPRLRRDRARQAGRLQAHRRQRL